MSSEIKSCYIHSDDKSLPAIYLPDEVPVTVGRSPETKITHAKCSREQVRLYACYAKRMVFVQQLGHRPCGLNGYKTERGAKLIAAHGDLLEILYGKFPYRVEFNPAPVCPAAESKKRLLSEDSESEDFQGRSSGKKMRNERRKGSTERGVAEKNPRRDENEARNSNEESQSCEKCESSFWEETGTLMIYTSVGVEGKSRIAAYDMDNTLIKTRSGGAFPKSHEDWQILCPEARKKLKKLHDDGYKIVIFTNQAGMFLGKIKPSDFKSKIERIVEELAVPVQVFIAAGKDIYRKPRIGMWRKLTEEKNSGVKIDKSKSFFVGDAAGRPKDWAPGKKKDHSSADRLFAINLSIDFYTPEEHFLGHKAAPYVLPNFDPKKLRLDKPVCDPSDVKLTPTEQEVVVMVGGPGSGKTHFAKSHLKSHDYVNRDELGSWQKCVAATERALSAGKSVVIDNTNPDVASRKRFVEVAKARGASVRCFVMTTEKEHARHNNRFRELTDPSHTSISDVIINSYSRTDSTFVWRCARFAKLLLLLCLRLLAGTLLNDVQPCRKNHVAPRREEGFSEIVRVNFVPSFSNEEHRRLYEMYLLEK